MTVIKTAPARQIETSARFGRRRRAPSIDDQVPRVRQIETVHPVVQNSWTCPDTD